MKLDQFTEAYITCMLWSTNDESDESGGEPLENNYSIEDIDPESMAKIIKDCKDFQAENLEDILQIQDVHCKGDSHGRCHYSGLESAGHDFWFTRCGHGVGFWDRGYPEAMAARLTASCKKFGECWPYVGDDNKIYI